MPTKPERPGVSADRARLDAAYRATTYRIDAGTATFDLRIGDHCLALDQWLRARGAACWAYLSADNPRSVVVSDAENLRRHEQLQACLRAQGLNAVLPGRSLADRGDWPDEAGVLVAGPDAAAASALAARFAQNAILVGRIGEPVRLLWVDESSDG